MAENPEQRTPEEAKQEDLNTRINTFISEYEALVKKHGIDFAQYPVYVPDGNGAFKTVLQNTPVDVSNQPVKSPIVITS